MKSGSFASSTGSLACRFCAGGRFANATGAVSCADCEAGRAQAFTGQASCGDCEAGRAQASKGSTTCRECAAGRYQPSRGSTACVACEAGKAGSRSGQTSCTFCGAGKYSDAEASSCTKCAYTRWSKAGSSFCSMCTAGYFLDEATDTCAQCLKDGVVCHVPGQSLNGLQIKQGYFRISPLAVDVRECPSGKKACMGGNASGFYCREGHGGPLCEICEHNYFRDTVTNACIKCDIDTIRGRLVLLGLFFVFVVLVLLSCCRRGKRYRQMSARLQDCRRLIMRSGARDALDLAVDGATELARFQKQAQSKSDADHKGERNDEQDAERGAEVEAERNAERTTSPQASITVPPPPAMTRRTLSKNVRRASMVVAGALELDVGLDLAANEDDEEQHLSLQRIKNKLRIILNLSQIISGIPFNLSVKFPDLYSGLLSFLGFTALSFGWVPIQCLYTVNHYENLAFTTLGSITVSLCLLCCHLSAAGRESGQFYFFVLLNFLYLILPGTSTVAVATFKCDYFPSVDTSYAVIDYTLVCESNGNKSSTRVFWETYAIVMIFLFPLGIPLMFGCLLYQRRYDLCPKLKERGGSYIFIRQYDWGREVEKSEESVERCAHLMFLTEMYEPHCFWFEIVESWRRLMLSSMLILLEDGSIMQVMVAIFICLLNIKIFTYYEPFDDDDDDQLAEAAQWQLFAIFFVVLLTRMNQLSSENGSSTGILLVAITAFSFVVLFIILLRIYCKPGTSSQVKERNAKLSKVVPVLSGDHQTGVIREETYGSDSEDSSSYSLDDPISEKGEAEEPSSLSFNGAVDHDTISPADNEIEQLKNALIKAMEEKTGAEEDERARNKELVALQDELRKLKSRFERLNSEERRKLSNQDNQYDVTDKLISPSLAEGSHISPANGIIEQHKNGDDNVDDASSSGYSSDLEFETRESESRESEPKIITSQKKSAIQVGNVNADENADDDSSWYSEDLSHDLSDNYYNEEIVSFSESNNKKSRSANVKGRQPGDVKDTEESHLNGSESDSYSEDTEESRLNRSEADSYSEDPSHVPSDAGNQELISGNESDLSDDYTLEHTHV